MLGLTLPQIAPQVPSSISIMEPDGGALRRAMLQRAQKGLPLPTIGSMRRNSTKAHRAVAELIHSKRLFPDFQVGDTYIEVTTAGTLEHDMYSCMNWADDEVTIACVIDDYWKVIDLGIVKRVYDLYGEQLAGAVMASINQLSHAAMYAMATPSIIIDMLGDYQLAEVDEPIDKLMTPDANGSYEQGDQMVTEALLQVGYDEDHMPLPSLLSKQLGAGMPTSVWMRPKPGALPTAAQWRKAGLSTNAAKRMTQLMKSIPTISKRVGQVLNRRHSAYVACPYSLHAAALIVPDLSVIPHVAQHLDDHVNARMESGDPNITLALSASVLKPDYRAPGDPFVAMAAHLDALGLIGELADILE